MSYYIRYVITDDKAITLPELEQGLVVVNSDYEIDEDVIVFEDEDYGMIEINVIGDGTFESDIDMLTVFANEKKNKDTLLEILQKAKSMITVQPVWEEREENVTLDTLKPIWKWLYANRPGLLIGEGGYFINEADELIE